MVWREDNDLLVENDDGVDVSWDAPWGASELDLQSFDRSAGLGGGVMVVRAEVAESVLVLALLGSCGDEVLDERVNA